MIEHGRTQAGTGAGGTGIGGADDERLLTAEEIAPLFDRKPRTIYEWWGLGKLGYVALGKKRKKATLAHVEARRRQLYREKHPLAALEALVPPSSEPAPPGAAADVHLDPRSVVGAIWPDVAEELAAQLAEGIRRNREELAALPKVLSMHLSMEYFGKVHRAYERMKGLRNGIIVASLTGAALVALAGALAP